MSAPRTSRGFFKPMLRAVLKALFRVRLDGDAAEFDNERTLIVANHESLLDGLLLAAFLPVNATFVVHTQVMKRALFRRVLRLIPHLVVDSTSPLAINSSCGWSRPARPW